MKIIINKIVFKNLNHLDFQMQYYLIRFYFNLLITNFFIQIHLMNFTYINFEKKFENSIIHIQIIIFPNLSSKNLHKIIKYFQFN